MWLDIADMRADALQCMIAQLQRHQCAKVSFFTAEFETGKNDTSIYEVAQSSLQSDVRQPLKLVITSEAHVIAQNTMLC